MFSVMLPGHLVYTFEIRAAKDQDKNNVKVLFFFKKVNIHEYDHLDIDFKLLTSS